MISLHHSARDHPANSGRASTSSIRAASASETLSPMVTRADSVTLGRAMRSRYPVPGNLPVARLGGLVSARHGAETPSQKRDHDPGANLTAARSSSRAGQSPGRGPPPELPGFASFCHAGREAAQAAKPALSRLRSGRARTVSHYTDRYYRYVSESADDGRAGGRRTRRWLVLAAGTVAVTAGCAFQYGL